VDELLWRRIQVLLVLLLHRREIHGLFDDVVVVEYLVLVDWLLEGPRITVVLHVVEQMEEGVVVGAVARGACKFVHDGRPARVLDGGDGEGIDRFDVTLGPLCRSGVDLVRLADGADLRICAFLLLQKHAARLEVADFGDHAALHDRAAFVVFDVAHPARLFERDFLGEALFLEVANGVVVGVGQEVHDLRGRFDIVFEVGHEMGAVAFDLLVRGDGAEDNLGELALVEGAVRDAALHRQHQVRHAVCEHLPNHLEWLLHDGDAHVRPVVDQPCNVVLGHLRQLFLEYALQAGQDDGALPPAVVVDHAELNVAVALLDGSGVLGERDQPLLGLGRRIVSDRGRRGALLLCALGRAGVEGVVCFALG
jgi:hypothetical protein